MLADVGAKITRALGVRVRVVVSRLFSVPLWSWLRPIAPLKTGGFAARSLEFRGGTPLQALG